MKKLKLSIMKSADGHDVLAGEIIEFTSGQTALEILNAHGIYVSAPCGGQGRCGKCKVQFLSSQVSVDGGNAPAAAKAAKPEEKDEDAGSDACSIPAPCAAEKEKLTEEELSQGIRLACMARPETDCKIRLLSEEEDFDVLSDMAMQAEHILDKGEDICMSEIDSIDNGIEQTADGKLYFAIDIGTTTLAISLVTDADEEPDAKDFAVGADGQAVSEGQNAEPRGRVIDTWTGVNHQRAYGADVISRIHAFDEGKGGELTASIKKDLLDGMQALMQKHHVESGKISKIVIAGNTTMGHLLLGYDCHGLGRMPFTPVNLKPVTVKFSELFGKADGGQLSTAKNEKDNAGDISDLFENDMSGLVDIPVTVMPGFTTFVGADIVSGLLYCKIYEAEKPSLFIDLGTNGEMAVGNKDRLLIASTAAGPAFEGGNISCGVGSIGGAICQIELEDAAKKAEQAAEFAESKRPESETEWVRTDGTWQIKVTTVRNEPPIGICGTGVIETAAELLSAELLDETGLLDEDYFDDGFVLAQAKDGSDIAFTQKDIRELQLAKAAVRGGLETLLLRYGISYDDLEHVYVAGGFGVHLDMKKAAAIGLLPEEVLDKVQAVGNTSLGGAVIYGQNEKAADLCKQMIDSAQEVDLSTDKDFQEFYMDAMFFE